MQIRWMKSLAELAPYADDWERLAGGVPFRGWTWLSHWWRHYGPPCDAEAAKTRLATLCVFDNSDALVGIAPWYLDGSAIRGRMLKALGVRRSLLGLLDGALPAGPGRGRRRGRWPTIWSRTPSTTIRRLSDGTCWNSTASIRRPRDDASDPRIWPRWAVRSSANRNSVAGGSSCQPIGRATSLRWESTCGTTRAASSVNCWPRIEPRCTWRHDLTNYQGRWRF